MWQLGVEDRTLCDVAEIRAPNPDLFDRDHRVVLSLQDGELRFIGVDAGDRRCVDEHLPEFLQAFLHDELRQELDEVVAPRRRSNTSRSVVVRSGRHDRGVGVFEAGPPGEVVRVSAASEARWPPAEPPVIATKSGSPPNAPMRPLTHARPRLTSTMCRARYSPGRRGSPATRRSSPPSAMWLINGVGLWPANPDHRSAPSNLHQHRRFPVTRQSACATRRPCPSSSVER